MIKKEKLTDKSIKEAVERERKIMVEVQHNNLMKMEYEFETEERHYYVMPFYDGAELRTLLNKKSLPLQVIKFYAVQIISAIGHMHKHNMIHRGLKSEDVLIDNRGYIKVIDFGLASDLSNFHKTMSIRGSVEFMAPEVHKSETSYESDWWALGALLYEMLLH